VLLSNSLLATVNEKLSGYTGYIRIVIICKVIANAVLTGCTSRGPDPYTNTQLR